VNSEPLLIAFSEIIISTYIYLIDVIVPRFGHMGPRHFQQKKKSAVDGIRPPLPPLDCKLHVFFRGFPFLITAMGWPAKPGPKSARIFLQPCRNIGIMKDIYRKK